MVDGSVRNLTRSEAAFVAVVLRELCDHFHEWRTFEGHEHSLVGFAYYEGCGDSGHCGKILAGAAPFALGKELVTLHGFRWVMVSSGDTWRYGVLHPALKQPVELHSLENGSWNDNENEYEEAPEQGKRTHDSLATIVKRVGELVDGE
jgi:hypothetical protein